MEPEKLKNVDDLYFKRVWEIMKQTYESERHFNGLEAQYRILASQWLLASFAGIGYIFNSDPHLNFNKLWIIVGICVVSSVGIWQLWRMDMLIYHRLLSACFSSGIDLEKQFDFLPKIKFRMLNSVPAKDVTHVMFYFYFFGIFVLSTIGVALTIYLLYDKIQTWIIACAVLSVLFCHVWIFYSMRKRSREKWIQEL